MYCPSAGAWFSRKVCEDSNLSVTAHVNSIFLLLKGLCFTGNPVYCLFLFYSGTVTQSLLSHLSALQIMKHLGEISLSSEKQHKEGLETHPEPYSQLGLENQAQGIKIYFFPNISSVSWLIEPKILRVDEPTLTNFNNPQRWGFTTQNLT